jgi:16S rRNA (cytosine967-C5)-methyltransferase
MKMETSGSFINAALNEAFLRKQLSNRDRAFVTALVMGTTRQRSEIDQIIQKHATRKLDDMPKLLLIVLRLGVLQLRTMRDIPQSAVLNTSCNLTRTFGHPGLVKFTNAVLRNCIRDEDGIENEKPDDRDTPNSLEMLSNKYSIPTWMVQRWLTNYGKSDTLGLLEYAQKQAPVVLRTCGRSITTEGLQNVLRAKKIVTRKGHLVSSCLIVEPTKGFHGPPQSIPGFTDGLFVVQDETSAFAGIIADPKPGEFVVDLCAAPGGKTLHLAELMENTGLVLAVDKSKTRFKPLQVNRHFLDLTNIQIKVSDGANLSLERPPDRILVDAPCLGTGVLNRRPDERTRKRLEDLAKLVEIQKRLLRKAASLLKVGGSLIYSTCSIEPEENIDNFRWFLEEHKNFSGEDIAKYLPEELLGLWQTSPQAKETLADLIAQAKQGAIQFLPSRHNVSGFFVARMKKLSVSN